MRTPIRCVFLLLAFVHAFPAIKHLAAFFTLPSTAEAWKGFGAVLAISLYLLPSTLQARVLIDFRLQPLLQARRPVLVTQP